MKYLLINFMLLVGFFMVACSSSSEEVTVYCTVDQVFSEPILKNLIGSNMKTKAKFLLPAMVFMLMVIACGNSSSTLTDEQIQERQ